MTEGRLTIALRRGTRQTHGLGYSLKSDTKILIFSNICKFFRHFFQLFLIFFRRRQRGRNAAGNQAGRRHTHRGQAAHPPGAGSTPTEGRQHPHQQARGQGRGDNRAANGRTPPTTQKGSTPYIKNKPML